MVALLGRSIDFERSRSLALGVGSTLVLVTLTNAGFDASRSARLPLNNNLFTVPGPNNESHITSFFRILSARRYNEFNVITSFLSNIDLFIFKKLNLIQSDA